MEANKNKDAPSEQFRTYCAIFQVQLSLLKAILKSQLDPYKNKIEFIPKLSILCPFLLFV